MEDHSEEGGSLEFVSLLHIGINSVLELIVNFTTDREG